MIEAGLRNVQDIVLPGLREMKGFVHGYWLADRQRAEVLAVTLWETEEDMQASAGAINQLRQQAMSAAGITEPPTITEYEVLVEG
jgi:heme-degrading monooxygenase HmoA